MSNNRRHPDKKNTLMADQMKQAFEDAKQPIPHVKKNKPNIKKNKAKYTASENARNTSKLSGSKKNKGRTAARKKTNKSGLIPSTDTKWLSMPLASKEDIASFLVISLSILNNLDKEKLVELRRNFDMHYKEKIQSKEIELKFSGGNYQVIKRKKKNQVKEEVRVSAACYLNPVIATPSATSIAINNILTTSNQRQSLGHGASQGEEDFIIGIDFGTTNTKVVIRINGQDKSWAVPFGSENSYLIPSTIYVSDEEYSLCSSSGRAINDLKLPLILNQFSDEAAFGVIAFLASIIRYARNWFLNNVSSNLQGFSFDWFYHFGLPANNLNNNSLVDNYKKIIISAIDLANSTNLIINISNVREAYHRTSRANLGDHELVDFIKIIPEIQAQLVGFYKSKYYDPNRNKFLMVDIGGGTVDVAILNIGSNKSLAKTYYCLGSRVEKCGAVCLHQERLDYLWDNITGEPTELKRIRFDLDNAKKNIMSLNSYPAKLDNYLVGADFTDSSFDQSYYKGYSDLVYGLVKDIKKRVDISYSEWSSLQTFICGGGSLNSFYKKIENRQLYDIKPLIKPSNCTAAHLNPDEYHRISVANGLSYMDVGNFISDKEIEPMVD